MRRHLVAVVAVLLFVAACSSSTEEASPTTVAGVAANPTTTTEMETPAMKVTSPAFEEGDAIPRKHSCNGENVSPQLDIADIPAETATLVLIMDDPDASGGTWDHWTAFDITPTTMIAEGDDGIGTGGLNSWNEIGYGGPCPPSGTHRYFFKVIALDSALDLGEDVDKATVISATEGHVLAEAILMGTFASGG